jgi:hypothetical protein
MLFAAMVFLKLLLLSFQRHFTRCWCAAGVSVMSGMNAMQVIRFSGIAVVPPVAFIYALDGIFSVAFNSSRGRRC